MRFRRLSLMLVVLSGCGGLAEPGGLDDPVVSSPVSPTPVPGPSYMEVEPRKGLVDVVPHIWDRAEPLDPHTIRVEFYGGVEECEGLDRVEVEETADTVTITLYTGRRPSAEVCIEIAVLKAVTVKLDAPLDMREIVDGAASAT